MAGVTKSSSPLHDKMCVAGSAILGGSIGSSVPVVGTLSGAAVGAIIGFLICSRDVVSKPIGNTLDFERMIHNMLGSDVLQAKAVNKLTKNGLIKNENAGPLVLRYALIEAKTYPDRYYQNSASKITPPAGGAAHGLSNLARKAGAVAGTVKS